MPKRLTQGDWFHAHLSLMARGLCSSHQRISLEITEGSLERENGLDLNASAFR